MSSKKNNQSEHSGRGSMLNMPIKTKISILECIEIIYGLFKNEKSLE
jgi:hypothetical protein